MAQRLSRRKIAEFVADKLMGGEPAKAALQEVAAYLYESRRTREYELIVRDVEAVLAEQGLVVADVTSAHALTPSLRDEIKDLLGATSVQFRETTDESVLGGVRVQVPGRRFDGTISRKLTALRAKQL